MRKAKGSGEHAHSCSLAEPVLFAHEGGRLRGNFSQRTRHVVSLRGKACALKIDWTKSPKSIFVATRFICRWHQINASFHRKNGMQTNFVITCWKLH